MCPCPKHGGGLLVFISDGLAWVFAWCQMPAWQRRHHHRYRFRRHRSHRCTAVVLRRLLVVLVVNALRGGVGLGGIWAFYLLVLAVSSNSICSTRAAVARWEAITSPTTTQSSTESAASAAAAAAAGPQSVRALLPLPCLPRPRPRTATTGLPPLADASVAVGSAQPVVSDRPPTTTILLL